MTDSIFTLDGEFVVPEDYARGPWNPEFLDGAAVSALLAHTVEAGRPSLERQLARLTIDLLAPVPMAPLRVVRQQVYEGKRFEVVDVTVLTADERMVCRASALLISEDDQPPFQMPATEIELSPGPEESRPFPYESAPVSFLNAQEMRFSRPISHESPGALWTRLNVPAFPDAPITPVVRAAAAADRASPATGMTPDMGATAINADMSIHFGRQPAGEWIGVEGLARLPGRGQGLGAAYLRDEAGLFGAASVSLMPPRFDLGIADVLQTALAESEQD